MDNDNLENRLDSEVVKKPKKVDSLSKAVEQVEKNEERLEAAEDASEDKKPELQQSGKKWLKIIFITIMLVIILLWAVPFTRNFIANTLGARTTLKIVTREQQPQGALVTLKNVEIQVDGQSYYISGNELELEGQKYGTRGIKVTKTGYAPFEDKMTVNFDPFFGLLSWKDTPVIYAHLKLSGNTFTFTAIDWLSGQPLSVGGFTVGDRTAGPSDGGKVSLVTPPSDVKKITVSASFGGKYLDKEFDIDPAKTNQEVTFIPAKRHYYTSNETGVLTVFSSYVDGSDKKECVKGTPNDTEIQFAVRDDGNYAVMVSTREGARDKNATLLQKVYWVNLSDCSIETTDSGLFIRLHDWLGESIAYTAAYRDAKDVNLKWRLRTLDTSTKNLHGLATATGFIGSVFNVHDTAVFTKSEIGAHPDAAKKTTLQVSGKDSNGKRELASDIEELYQLDHQRFAYKVASGQWSEVNINTGGIRSAQAPGTVSKVFLSTPNKRGDRAYVEFSDDGRTLKVQTIDEKADIVLVTDASIRGPIRYLNDTALVYRSGNADYAVSTLGGQPKKIADVLPSSPAAGLIFSFH